MKFKTTPVTVPLYGHSLTAAGMLANTPKVTGTFAADPVTGNDGEVFGVFTVPDSETKAYPSYWAGTYRINVDSLKGGCPEVFESL